MSAAGGEVRGPRLGDAASLWNFTPSPGWTKDQVAILRLALMKYGIGRWVQILDTGLLPGKLIQQLNGQTQRLLGQQSLAAYTGLHVDIDRIRADNESRKDAQRKSGLIIWSGPNPTKQMKADWQQEAQAKYGLNAEQIAEAETLLEEMAATAQAAGPSISLPLIDIMDMPLDKLEVSQKVQLLIRLRRKLQSLLLSLEAPSAAIGAELPTSSSEGASSGKRGSSKARARSGKAKSQKQTSKVSRKESKVEALPERQPSKRARTATRSRRFSEVDDESEQGYEAEAGGAEGSEGGGGGEAAAAASVALESDLAQLQAMGFTKAKSKAALEECGNDVQSALDWLVTNCI